MTCICLRRLMKMGKKFKSTSPVCVVTLHSKTISLSKSLSIDTSEKSDIVFLADIKYHFKLDTYLKNLTSRKINSKILLLWDTVVEMSQNLKQTSTTFDFTSIQCAYSPKLLDLH